MTGSHFRVGTVSSVKMPKAAGYQGGLGAGVWMGMKAVSPRTGNKGGYYQWRLNNKTGLVCFYHPAIAILNNTCDKRLLPQGLPAPITQSSDAPAQRELACSNITQSSGLKNFSCRTLLPTPLTLTKNPNVKRNSRYSVWLRANSGFKSHIIYLLATR